MMRLMTARRADDLDASAAPLKERDLVIAFNAGDEDAYREIYDAYMPRARSICRRMLGDDHDAQEACQEVFLKVFQSLPRFNGRYQLGAWIARITTNHCLDVLRSRTRRPGDVAPYEELPDVPEPAPATSNPEVAYIRKAEGHRVRRVLDSLPPLHRAAIVLRDFEGLSYAEVADALSLSEGQVKALLFRARKGFKRSWAPLAGLFVPSRWLPRVRRADADDTIGAARAAQPVAEAATSVTQVASSCSAALQHCGQFVGERFATVATTVVVGAATIGGAGAAVRHDPAEPVPDHARHAISSAAPATTKVEPPIRRRKPQKAPVVPDVTEPGKLAPPAEPEPADAPVPEPSPSPTPSPSPSPPPPTPAPDKPAVQQFTPAVGFARGQSIAPAPVRNHELRLSCSTKSVEQRFTTQISDGDASYPGALSLRAWSTSGRVHMTFVKDGLEYRYTSWGPEPVATWTAEGSRLVLELTGDYGPVYGSPPPGDAGLPTSGTFVAKLTIDCSAPALTSQSVTFSV